MKTKEKNEVIDLFITHRKAPKDKYKALVALLLKLPDATPGQKRFYNAARYSPGTLSSLEYDVKKLCGIQEKELYKVLKRAKEPVPLTGEQRLLALDPEASRDILLQEASDLTEFSKLDKYLPTPLKIFTKGLPGNAERKAWLEEKEVDHKLTTKAELDLLILEVHEKMVVQAQNNAIAELLEQRLDLLKTIEYHKKEAIAKEKESILSEAVSIFKDAPEEAKQGIKLRDEFPFLSETDCPDEFKILVADKFTAYYKFVDGRKELKVLIAAGATNEDIFEIAKETVANFELNLDCYDELEYYKEHQQILGKHPIFADHMLKEKVATMSTMELTKRQKNLRTYVSKDEKAFKKMEEGDAKLAFGQKIVGWNKELQLVDARLEKIS